MRIGLLGAGYMGSLHAAAYAAMDDVEIAGIVGRGIGRAGELGRRFDAPAHTDAQTLFDDASVDAVDITLPTALHREFGCAALEAGKHVLCETPLAATVVDADAMLRAAKIGGRHLQVALLMRFAHQAVAARRIVTSGEFGEPLTVTTRRLAPGTGGPHHGDAIEELLLFDLDMLGAMLGNPESATAAVVRDESGRIQHVLADLTFGRTRAWAEASFLLPKRVYPFTATTTVICERGTVETMFRAGFDGPPVAEVARYPVAGEPTFDRDLGENPYAAECRHFVDVIRGDADADYASGETARDSSTLR